MSRELSMGNERPLTEVQVTEISDQNELRGINLNGSDQQSAVDHSEYVEARGVDTELRLDAESDSLYDDGIDIEADFDTWAGTTASLGTIP